MVRSKCMIPREFHLQRIRDIFRVHPVGGILGPRQVGKSTLARNYADAERLGGTAVTYFDLERDEDMALFRNPMDVLGPLKGLVVIDEVQRLPDLFRRLRVLVDEQARQVRYLILGSASPELLRQSSESLAGRIDYLELTPLNVEETGMKDYRRLWQRGGYPRSYLADSEEASVQWRKAYIRNFLERDLPALGLRIPPETLRRFWLMMAHYHGQIFHASDLAKSMGIDGHTVRHYLDILTGTFMIRRLSPWHENLGKRQVKSPKFYFRDSGLFHILLGPTTEEDLLRHPKFGASWEGFALEEIIRREHAAPEEVYFWGTHGAAELDLLLIRDGKRIGYEVKYAAEPSITKSMRTAQQDLRLDILYFVYPGKHRSRLDQGIEAVGFESLLS
jgi:predicted AAA+ superfamily ATPase